MRIEIQRLNDKYKDLPLPTYATEGSAGMDIYAAIDENITIQPGGIELIPTSLAMSVLPGYECQVRSRSGLAFKYGIFALNSPGTIDSDYRGEIKVILANFGKKPYTIERGDRIAQLIISKYEHIKWDEVSELSETDRGSAGFGSTGK